MKRLSTILVLLPFMIANAQNYVDILHSEYTATPQNTFDSSSQTTGLEKVNVNLTTPIKLKNGNALLTGVVYDRVSTRLDTTESVNTQMSSVILKMGMNIKHSKKWSTTVLLLPKIATDYMGDLSKRDFQVGGIVLTKMKKTEHLSYKCGAYLNGDRFGPFLVPLFGFYYQKNKLEMDVIVPSYAKINYSIIPKVMAGINWRATVKSYNLHKGSGLRLFNDNYMHHLSNEVAANVGYEPIKGVIIRGVAGVSLGRSFKVYENDDKIDFGLSLFRFGDDRVPLNITFQNGMFYRAEVAYRVYL
ncbi:MAG: hypothetical protein HOI49_08415 [Bacteroidetes bacterium]|nr:hypothetical protein [Bacteroidota bacterium]